MPSRPQAIPSLLARYTRYRKTLDLAQLETWLAQLEDRAEVDNTCQSSFTGKEVLARWQEWDSSLAHLTEDENINKRRASLVLLKKPLTDNDDPRLLTRALANVTRRQHEQDRLITKAVSWVLRAGIKHHREAIAAFLDDNADTLPRHALRETRKKLNTGKK